MYNPAYMIDKKDLSTPYADLKDFSMTKLLNDVLLMPDYSWVKGH